MSLPSVQDASRPHGNPRRTILSLPAELLITIYCFLPSFTDVFVLSSASHHFHDIWTGNVSKIYRNVAPQNIPCLRHARQFLADQGGPAINSAALTAKEVVRMVKNAQVVEDAIVQFEREIVCRVRCSPASALSYGAAATGHPPTLTRTERPRFIKSYYQLWGLMKLKDAEKWEMRLNGMNSKDLYLLEEIVSLTQSMGRGDELMPPPCDDEESNPRASEERRVLSLFIRSHIQDINQRLYNGRAPYLWNDVQYEDSKYFLILWDHSQPSLWRACTRSQQRDPAFVRKHIWVDSSEDEVV